MLRFNAELVRLPQSINKGCSRTFLSRNDNHSSPSAPRRQGNSSRLERGLLRRPILPLISQVNPSLQDQRSPSSLPTVHLARRCVFSFWTLLTLSIFLESVTWPMIVWLSTNFHKASSLLSLPGASPTYSCISNILWSISS